jgi:hypothetical protein
MGELVLRSVEPSEWTRGEAPLTTVVVNATPPTPTTLVINLVKDAFAGDADVCASTPTQQPIGRIADPLTVPSLCRASGPQTIDCSYNALEFATRPDRDNGVPSAALFFVLAHELGHIAHGERGGFFAGVGRIDLGLARARKVALLRTAFCPETVPMTPTLRELADEQAAAVRRSESAADAIAVRALVGAVTRPPFAPPPAAIAKRQIGIAEYANWLSRGAFDARRFEEIWFADGAWSFDSNITQLTRTPNAAMAYVCGFLDRSGGTASFVSMVDAAYPDPIDRTITPALALFDLEGRIEFPDGGPHGATTLLALRTSTERGWNDTKRIRDYMRTKACEYLAQESLSPGSVDCASNVFGRNAGRVPDAGPG